MTQYSMDELAQVCGTCGQTRQWHLVQGSLIKHSFDGPLPIDQESGGDRSGTDSGSAPPSPSTRSATRSRALQDPGLRLALVKKGLIEEGDLEEADGLVEFMVRQGVGTRIEIHNHGESSSEGTDAVDDGGAPDLGDRVSESS